MGQSALRMLPTLGAQQLDLDALITYAVDLVQKPPPIPVRLTRARAEQVIALAERLGVPPHQSALVLYALVAGHREVGERNQWIRWLKLLS
ncbi:MAG: hypothetical protein HY329_08970 [Chloroflexi bacterium]|nr:hypothetical protein [Chloroflexota bacterium]